MATQCYLCDGSFQVHPCSCVSPVSLCLSCDSLHSKAHDQQAQSRNLYCSYCVNHAAQVCIECMTYLCEQCAQEHEKNDPMCDMYSIPLGDLVSRGEYEKLKRGKTINKGIENLREIIAGIGVKIKADIELAFEAANIALETAKNQSLSKVDAEVKKLSQEIDSMEIRITQSKFSDLPNPTIYLEQLLFSESFPALKSTFESKSWIEVSSSTDLLASFFDNFVHLQRSTTLFDAAMFECSWVNQYALLVGKSVQFCNLDSMESIRSEITIPEAESVVCIQIPTAEFFICGGRSGDCHIIDNNYSAIEHVGRLVTPCNNPGLGYFNGSVFIFGGKNPASQELLSNIQQFSYNSKKVTELSCQMTLGRACFTPCIYKKQIYLIGGLCNEGIEIFNPVIYELRILVLRIMDSGPTIIIPHSENKLLVLGIFQWTFDVVSEKMATVAFEKKNFTTQLHPIEFKGRYYFTTYLQEEKKFRLVSLGNGETKVDSTKIEFS